MTGERGETDDASADGVNPDETKSGTFLVTAADEASAVLASVADGQVCPLDSNPDLSVDDVVEATLAPVGPLGVTWEPVDVVERWTPEIDAVDEPPGERAREVAEEHEPGELAQVTTEVGELHVLVVEAEHTEAAVGDVLADETTRRIAARLGARRVEVRGAAGVVGVRYMR